MSCWVWAAAMNIYKNGSIFKHAPEYIASNKCQVNGIAVLWESQGELHYYYFLFYFYFFLSMTFASNETCVNGLCFLPNKKGSKMAEEAGRQ